MDLKDKRVLMYLALIIGLAFVLRTLWLSDTLFFGWEQGRDFLKLSEIASGDLTLVGPKTDIDGVFHGALSYYIPLVPYIVFGGDPYLTLISYILITSLSIVFLYKAIEDLYTQKAALVSVLIFAVSYPAIIYSRWLSNPNLVPALTIFYFFCLVRAKKDWRYLIGSAISFAIMVHLIVVVPMSLIIPTLVFMKIEKVKLTVKRIIGLVIVMIPFFTTYAIFELKNNFLMIHNILNDQSSSGNLLSSGISFVDQFYNEVLDNFIPTIPRLSFVIFIIVVFYCVYRAKKMRSIPILIFLLATPILFLFIPDSPLRHFFITLPIFMSVLIALTFNDLLKRSKMSLAYGLLLLVISANLYAIGVNVPESKGNFIHHAQRTYYGDMLDVVDYVYLDADGSAFSYDYYSVPYWKEEAWKYLFEWYGESKYGYMPQYDRTEVFYTIMEPNETVPVHRDNWYGEYKKGLELLDSKKFGDLEVEKRREKIVEEDE